MSSSLGMTLSSVGGSLIVALLSLAYWEVRARAAHARANALSDDVKANREKLDSLASPPAPPPSPRTYGPMRGDR